MPRATRPRWVVMVCWPSGALDAIVGTFLTRQAAEDEAAKFDHTRYRTSTHLIWAGPELRYIHRDRRERKNRGDAP